MIRVDINLVPRGVHIEEKKLYTLTITNDGSGDNYIGNYKIKAKDKHGDKELLSGEVRGFDRLEKDSLDLLQLALEAILG
jgi:hypothetical protein